MTRSNPDGPLLSGRRLAALLAIVAVGAALRLAKLDGLSLTHDELYSVTHAWLPLPSLLLSSAIFDIHPPLYYLLLSGWITLGRSDAVVLLFSILLGVALVPSVYYVAGRLYGVGAALPAAMMCAVHPLAVFWSQHARMYALVMLLAVWAFYFGARHAVGGGRRLLVATVVVEVGLLYSHNLAIFAAVFIWAVVLLEHVRTRAEMRRWLAAHGVVVLCWLPLGIVLLGLERSYPLRPGPIEVARTLTLFLNGVGNPGPLLVALARIVFLAATLLLLVRPRDRMFAAGFLIAPIVAGVVVSHAIRPIWVGARTFAFLAPFICIAIARLYAGDGRGRPGRASRLVAAAALVLCLRGALDYTLHGSKVEQYVEAARAVRAGARPGDVVVLHQLAEKRAFNWYYMDPDWDRELWPGSTGERLRLLVDADARRDLTDRLQAHGSDPGSGLRVVVVPGAGERLAAEAARVWIVTRSGRGRRELIQNALGLTGPPTPVPVTGLDVTLWERSPGMPGAPAATR